MRLREDLGIRFDGDGMALLEPLSVEGVDGGVEQLAVRACRIEDPKRSGGGRFEALDGLVGERRASAGGV